MNAFEYAMKMEMDGKKYYEEEAAKMADPAMMKIFVELAKDEQSHYNIFKAMLEGGKPDYKAAFKTSILATTKNVFQKMRASGKKVGEFPAGVKVVWERAREIEDKSEKFYRKQADETTDKGQKAIWTTIAGEERKHWVALDNVINFLNRPDRWLEDAEWSNLESY